MQLTAEGLIFQWTESSIVPPEIKVGCEVLKAMSHHSA